MAHPDLLPLPPSVHEPGLTSVEASRRLAADGPNEVAGGGQRHGLRILLAQLRSPLVLVLVLASLVSRLLGERVEALVILLIVALNAALGFVQEYRAERTLRSLRRYLTPTARVRRDGRIVELPAAELVRGDVVELEVGDLVPADLELTAADNLSLDESSLTGESIPVARDAGERALMGTALVSGYGTGRVTVTGSETFLARTAGSHTGKSEATDFQRNIRRFSDFLVQVIFALTALVFLANALLGKGWFDSFLFAVALAVGITPEMLPAIVTITLARGALRMSRDKVIVRRLMSVEDLGNMDILCCDKTGTLTEGKFSLHDFVNLDGVREPRVLIAGALAASAGNGIPEGAGNPTDRAIWASPELATQTEALAAWRVLDRNAFDFRRRRASALVTRDGARLLVVKGAAESVLDACTAVHRAAAVEPMTPETRRRLGDAITRYEEDGLRVIAVADRPCDRVTTSDADERDLAFLGFLLFLDPPKATVRESLERLTALGVGIRIMSGDSEVVTRRICREVGLSLLGNRVVTGPEISGLGEAELRRLAGEHNVFARVTPEQKQRLVAALRSSGHVTGFLGDGVNDVPALRAADVGVAVDSGADIAKDAADIILLQKSLGVLADGIVEGRKTFANITKYILNTVSANFGNMFTVATSSLFLRFIPLLPSQILLNNLLSDVPLVTVATDRVDRDLLRRPRRWNIPAIARFMIGFGLLSALFDLLLIVVLLGVWRADTALFRTAWFVESAGSEIIVTFAIRTRARLLRSPVSLWLVGTSLLAGSAVFLLPFTSLGRRYFEFVSLPAGVTVLIAALLLSYVLAAELAKRPFFRRFDL